MPPVRNDGGSRAGARARHALERGATTLGVQLARSVEDGWRRMSPSRRAKLEQLAANVRERKVEQRGAIVPPPANVAAEVSDVEVHDLRADLARELERLAHADIRAARGTGGVASDAASADGQA
jgi:hypothetical protein